MWKVIAKSWGCTRWTVTEFDTEEEAVDYCEYYGWRLCEDGGYVWDLEIDGEEE